MYRFIRDFCHRSSYPGLVAALALLLLGAAAAPAAAQTDYYNLDKERPLRVEDAYATERYAFEFQLSPLTLTGLRNGGWVYVPSLEVKHGLLPGLEVSAGVNANVVRAAGETTRSLGDLELSALYNLNSETLRIPALGVRVTGHLPLEGDEGASAEVKGIVTRVLFGPLRAHLNGALVLGEHASERWWAGAAVDYVLPFHSLVFLAETFVGQPRAEGAERAVHSTAGLRYQLTPWTGMDAGVGRSWAGPERDDWRVTFGITTALGFRPFMRLR